MFVALQLLGSTRRGASILTNMVLFPLLMVGGSFFPFESMPGWMAAVGRVTPNGWVLSTLKDVLGGSVDAATLAARLAALVVVGAALFAFAARRVARGFA
jgi:ABC-type multidrug transport system permease subunit